MVLYTSMRNSTELAFVMGIDGAGKSSLMSGLRHKLGYVALEPTTSPEAKAFKAQHAGVPLEMDLVFKRRQLFRKINRSFDKQINTELLHSDVATSGLRLVTDISYAVMSKVIGNQDYSTAKIIENCRRANSLMPDTVAFVYAPTEIIRERILRRQARGESGEDFTGFNSLFFLGHYQEALHDVSELLASDCNVVSIDTSIHTKSETLALFSAANPKTLIA